LFFVVTLAPLLGFVMLYTFRYTFVADHYQYLACIGPIALSSAGLVTLSRVSKRGQWLVGAAGLIILVCLSLLAWRQSASYRDEETLWRTTIARNSACWMAYGNLGVIQFQKGNLDDAVNQYETALSLNSAYPEAHYNLASALLQQGKIDDAITHCQRAIQLQPTDPDAHVVLGNAFMGKQNLDRAIREYEQAINLRPEDSNAHYNLGAAFQAKGENDRAALEYQKAGQFERH
jgi:tetratricopeptide (TPR) repeat protein